MINLRIFHCVKRCCLLCVVLCIGFQVIELKVYLRAILQLIPPHPVQFWYSVDEIWRNILFNDFWNGLDARVEEQIKLVRIKLWNTWCLSPWWNRENEMEKKKKWGWKEHLMNRNSRIYSKLYFISSGRRAFRCRTLEQYQATKHNKRKFKQGYWVFVIKG